MKNAPSINPKNITCLTRLDQNRLVSQLSHKINIPNNRIKNVIIWGNHSTTQYPDIISAVVQETDSGLMIPIIDYIKDEKWIQNELLKNLQNRVILK